MIDLDNEPIESMYPEDTDRIHFERHKNIWQALGPRKITTFVRAKNPKEANKKILNVFEILLNCKLEYGDYQFRRLPIYELKER